MSKIVIPSDYVSKLNLLDTEIAIKQIKDMFERRLAETLRLTRVSAPLFVEKISGLNDDLSGKEKAVSFVAPDISNHSIEIIHSLAKWKRLALHRYNFGYLEGLYTDMNAIRREEELDNLHSIYVDQWDWELVIKEDDRQIEFLKYVVNKIYNVFLELEYYIVKQYPQIGEPILPSAITFITSQELENLYPNLSSKERENEIAKQHKAVFLMQIGDKLLSGEPHDLRAPDYDDWSLNGDIILWYEPLQIAIELSSMGIRVNDKSMKEQLIKSDKLERLSFPFHQGIINKQLPLTIGGGIGQSRLCMFFLRKIHIGEVQSSLWSKEIEEACVEANIELL